MRTHHPQAKDKKVRKEVQDANETKKPKPRREARGEGSGAGRRAQVAEEAGEVTPVASSCTAGCGHGMSWRRANQAAFSRPLES
jgi:hypothetical protein